MALTAMPSLYVPRTARTRTPSTASTTSRTPPALDRFVFIKANKDLGDVQIDSSGETAFISKGDTHALRYGPVRDYVLDGRLSLV